MLVSLALLTLSAVACVRTVRVDFDRQQSALLASVRVALSAPIPGSEKAVFVDLPVESSRLAVDGRALHIRKHGREFVFFPQSVEGEMLYTGLLYVVDGGDAVGILDTDAEQIGTNWWSGELSGEFLA